MLNDLQQKWEKTATVRTRPRIMFDNTVPGYLYPLSRQPLGIHPKVEALGTQALTYLLAQSLYKYSNDIAIIETRFVNQAILMVITDAVGIVFTAEQKMSLYTIMVDEAYHAYVAYDSMLQIQHHTGIRPLSFPKEIEIELAMRVSISKLPLEYHGVFRLIAVCLAENTLTKEMAGMLDQDETHPFIQQILQDHLSDESRHSGIFYHLLRYIWATISDDCKQHISTVLPEFITLYLGRVIQSEFEKCVLIEMGFSSNEADEILDDTYGHFKITRHHPMLKNMLNVLTKAGVVDEFVSPHLKENNWL